MNNLQRNLQETVERIETRKGNIAKLKSQSGPATVIAKWEHDLASLISQRDALLAQIDRTN